MPGAASGMACCELEPYAWASRPACLQQAQMPQHLEYELYLGGTARGNVDLRTLWRLPGRHARGCGQVQQVGSFPRDLQRLVWQHVGAQQRLQRHTALVSAAWQAAKGESSRSCTNAERLIVGWQLPV